MIAWLQSINVPFGPELKKPEFYALTKRYKPINKIYEIDELAKEQNLRVIRLHPYHRIYDYFGPAICSVLIQSDASVIRFVFLHFQVVKMTNKGADFKAKNDNTVSLPIPSFNIYIITL